MPSINLFCAITANNGERVPMQISTECSSTELKQEVSKATKIPLAELRLIFRGKMIKDDSSPAVSTYQLENDDVLHCMGKPVSGPVPVTASAVSPANNNALYAAPAAVPTIPAASYPLVDPGLAVDPLQSALTTIRISNPPQAYSTAVTTLSTVLSNIADNPMEEKYRRVKKGNVAFNKKLGGLNGGDAAMKAVGFVLEVQDGAEYYQLHASPEAWPKLMAAKATVEAAAEEAKRIVNGPAVQPIGAANPLFPGTGPGAFPGMMGSLPAPGAAAAQMNDPMVQRAMAEMMRNPETMRQMLQHPMVQQMIQNDPNISPMQRNTMQELASNPAMLDQLSTMMSNPAIMSRFQSMMGGGGGMPGMPPRIPTQAPQAGASSGNNSANNLSGNDQDQTEDEMIAEAIRRSLQDN